MNTVANVVDAEVVRGLADAKEWLVRTTKFAGLQSKVVVDRPGVCVSNIVTVGCENHVRIDKFKAMVRRAVAGFDKSPAWTCTRSEYNGWVYVSSDKKWQVTITDRYNGSGGWKVATLTLGIQIKVNPQ